MRNKCACNYNKLVEFFGKDKATGQSSKSTTYMQKKVVEDGRRRDNLDSMSIEYLDNMIFYGENTLGGFATVET